MIDNFLTTILMVIISKLADVLDIRKLILMLQSGRKSRRLDFIFDSFMECVKFTYYFLFLCFL